MGILTITAVDGTNWTDAGFGSAGRHTTWNTIWSNVVTELQNNLQPVSNMTVTITRDFNTTSTGGGESTWSTTVQSYATVKSTLQGLTKNSMQTTAFNALPASDPIGVSSGYELTNELARAIGIAGITAGTNTVTIQNAAAGTTWDETLDGSTCAAGLLSAYGVIKHEITEVLGRFMRGSDISFVIDNVADLFTYQSNGVRNFTSANGQFRYLSHNGGSTIIFQMNQSTATPPGDRGDTDPGSDGIHSPFAARGELGRPANPGGVSFQQDWKYLTLCGWGLTTAGLTAAGLSGSPPTNTVAPSISGDPGVGHVLTVTQGTWTNSPTSISHQWISGVTNVGTNSTTYTPVTGDIGNAITVSETATNASGSNSATSSATAKVRPVFSVTA